MADEVEERPDGQSHGELHPNGERGGKPPKQNHISSDTTHNRTREPWSIPVRQEASRTTDVRMQRRHRRHGARHVPLRTRGGSQSGSWQDYMEVRRLAGKALWWTALAIFAAKVERLATDESVGRGSEGPDSTVIRQREEKRRKWRARTDIEGFQQQDNQTQGSQGKNITSQQHQQERQEGGSLTRGEDNHTQRARPREGTSGHSQQHRSERRTRRGQQQDGGARDGPSQEEDTQVTLTTTTNPSPKHTRRRTRTNKTYKYGQT